ncbi:MAG: ABC transporter permease [Candidatus Rokubacteria bacterium]|nr:ABC transporter permease [Candidatus Rokubacteria bacterium]
MTPGGRLRRFARGFVRRWTAPAGLGLLLVVLAMAISAPYLFPEDPFAMVTRPLLWPGQERAYLLGSDMLGRDLLAGIFHGARVSLSIGAAATAAALGVGVLVGALAGFHGGLADDLLMRGTEAFQTIPPFVFVIVVVVIARPSIRSIVLAIALVSWPSVARLVRAEFLALRHREFVQACRAVGMGDLRIAVRQILPNALPPIIVTASIMVATAILTESALAFLGLGDPNVMSWGSMIGAGREMLRTEWYLTAVPGLAILLTVLALNLIGEGLNDALNPKLNDR